MYDEELERLIHRLPEKSPSPEAKGRILSACRQVWWENEASHRRQRRWRWGFATATLLLLVANGMIEKQDSARISALLNSASSPQVIVKAPSIQGLRSRRTMVASLLREISAF
jgi:hypothetical protein